MAKRNSGAFMVEKVLAKYMDERSLYAAEIAKKAGCSLPSAYRRIEKLRELGADIQETKPPRKQKGPTPTKYRLRRFAL